MRATEYILGALLKTRHPLLCIWTANGQLRSGYVYNWTSWLDDYGFGKCTDPTKCNVFPDGKPFPQSNDWRRKSYIYVWHTMGQYYETCDGSSSSVTINTTNIPLGGEVMEVMVYRKRERRKYSPLTSDNTVFLVTDKIPLAVDISQKSVVNKSASVFIRGEEIVFKVQLHDPSGYLKTAASVDYIWDFRDGNQVVTHREVTTHTYSTLGRMNVKLVVEAAFPVECPPTSATPTPRRPTSPPLTGTRPRQLVKASWSNGMMFFGMEKSQSFQKSLVLAVNVNRILDVSAARVTNTDVSFRVKCLGSIPTSACTIVSDPSCSQVRNIMCDDVPPSSECEVRLRRRFLEPGTYCVNITLENSSSMALASTTITISKSQDAPAPKTSNTAQVVLTSSAVLVGVFAIVAYMVYRRHKVYRPIRRSLVEDACANSGAAGHMVRLREALFPSSEESRHLLTERQAL
uniref:Glycoprotein (transmembrane) nmb n=1 Tax=Poecilia formosa TaxID=48698 RepID=A0A096MBA0_POEFO